MWKIIVSIQRRAQRSNDLQSEYMKQLRITADVLANTLNNLKNRIVSPCIIYNKWYLFHHKARSEDIWRACIL